MNSRQKQDMRRWERAEADGTITTAQDRLLAHWRKVEKMEAATAAREARWRAQD